MSAANPDGSDFEVFAAGIRNLQEFAFDEYGNIVGNVYIRKVDRVNGELYNVEFETVRIAGFGKQLLRLLGIIGRRRDLQREVHHPRDEDPGRRAVAKAGRLVGRLPIERVVDGDAVDPGVEGGLAAGSFHHLVAFAA